MSHRVSSTTPLSTIPQLKEQCRALLLDLNVQLPLDHSRTGATCWRRKARQVEEDLEEDEEAELGDEDEDGAGGQMNVDGEENGDFVCTTFDISKAVHQPLFHQQDLGRKTNGLVRLALFCEHKRTPLRRDDITKKVSLSYCFRQPNNG